jgi:hypothetical protein
MKGKLIGGMLIIIEQKRAELLKIIIRVKKETIEKERERFKRKTFILTYEKQRTQVVEPFFTSNTAGLTSSIISSQNVTAQWRTICRVCESSSFRRKAI